MPVKKKKYKSGEHALTPEQVDQLISVVEDFTHEVFLRLAVSTGIRRGDIVRLQWENVDLEDNRIKFYEAKKDKQSEVYVSDELCRKLKMLFKQQDGEEYYLFPGRSEQKRGKGHISSRTAYNILQRYLDKAGLPQRPFHSLRATCAKLCQAAGWSEEQAAKHIGDTIATIRQHYTTPSDEEMKKVAKEKPIK